MSKASRNKETEKALKKQLKNTHIRAYSVVGSRPADDDKSWWVYFARILDGANYLYKVKAVVYGSGYRLGNIIGVSDPEELSLYKMYAPRPGTIAALKPTEKERARHK